MPFMVGASWTSIIGLIGALLGGSLTVISQWISQRVQIRQQQTVQHEARRAERLTRLVQFFEVAQEGERVVVERLRAMTLTKMRTSATAMLRALA
jgi:hypothetical protein